MIDFNPSQHDFGSNVVQDTLQDVRQLGECLSLRLMLSQYTGALHRLIDDLEDRAFEARNETHPDSLAAQNFRNLFSDAIRRFWSVVSPPAQNDDASLRRAAYDSSDRFLEALFELLPSIGRSMIAAASTPPTNYNWADRLTQSADAADQMARELREQLGELSSELDSKHQLLEQVNDALSRLSRIFPT